MDLIRNFLGGGSNGEEPDAKRVKREDDGSAGAANGGAIGTSTSGAGGAGGAGADGKVDHLGQYAMLEIHLRKQEEDGELVYMVIKNDGEEQNMIWLVNLKNIFSKQLPNMPKEYIVRLVMDPRHHSMICMKNNTVIGGITYRPFWRQNMG